MALTEKRRLIKDPVWGNLEVFAWENRLLNHFLFNRLHNIVQNSSAFKVYPGLKYSRFLHTVGVAHVATQLFLNAAAKAEGEALDALRVEVAAAETHLKPEAKASIQRSLAQSFPCAPEFAVLLAAIRVSALIHDIGHLPYSHVFENAIDGFRRGEYEQVIPTKPKGKEQRKRLNELLAPHEIKEDVKLHELLGAMFVRVLQHIFATDAELNGLLHVGEQILATESFPISRGFIIGTIDADRIDFVRRDGLFSGLFNSSVDFARLFAFYELAKSAEDNGWRPRPSNRALSETEKLLFERFQDYKYIVVHHRVHLYDEIMENILVRLMADGTLRHFVDNLCKLLSFVADGHQRLRGELDLIHLLHSLLLEFDDPWVEIEIRKQYRNAGERDVTTQLLFEAYVEDRQCFASAFKSDEEFEQVCSVYAPQLAKPDAQTASSVRNAFGASKYILQDHLSKKLKRTILVGATDKKLSYGIRNENAAEFFGVADLRNFLVQKKIRSLTFNLWYEKKATTPAERSREHEQIMKIALPYLQAEVTKQLSLNI